jgi:hypothetical protein
VSQRPSRRRPRVTVPKPFRVFVNSFADARGRVWAAQYVDRPNRYWHAASLISLPPGCHTVFSPQRFKRHEQPWGWIAGVGVITRIGDALVITG